MIPYHYCVVLLQMTNMIELISAIFWTNVSHISCRFWMTFDSCVFIYNTLSTYTNCGILLLLLCLCTLQVIFLVTRKRLLRDGCPSVQILALFLLCLVCSIRAFFSAGIQFVCSVGECVFVLLFGLLFLPNDVVFKNWHNLKLLKEWWHTWFEYSNYSNVRVLDNYFSLD